jgi:hypothetical protein
MGALKELLAVFTFKVDDAPLKKADKSLEGFAKKVVGAFAASEIIGGIKEFVSSTLEAGDAITDTAAALGVSRESLQAWQYAGGQVGVSADGISTSMKFLQKNAVDGSAAFAKIGVTVKDAHGNIAPVEDLMFGVAKGLSEVKDPALRTKLALELLGKGGAQMNALFDAGSGGIDEMMKRFKELGGGFSEDMLDKMDAAGDAISDTTLAVKGLKGAIVTALAPSIKKGADELSKLIVHFRNGVETSTHLKAALITLGVVGAAAGVTMLAPYIPFLIALAAIYLAIDDIYTFFKGGDSGTGRLLDYLFGSGGAAGIRNDILNLKSTWEDFKKETEKANKPGKKLTVGDYFEEGFSEAGSALVTQFMTSFGTPLGQYLMNLPGQIAPQFFAAMGNLFSPGPVLGKAYALGAQAVEMIAKAITVGAPKVIRAISNPFESIVLPNLLNPTGTPGQREDAPGPLGTILDFIPGVSLRHTVASISAPRAPNYSDVRSHTNNRVDVHVHGAPDPSTVARATGRAVHGVLNDDVDQTFEDVAGMA